MNSISLGPLAIPLTLLPWLFGFLGAWTVAMVRRRKEGRPDVEPLLWWSAVAALACARLGFVIQYHQAYAGQWLAALDLRDGGLWWPGALIGVALVLALAPGTGRREQRRERLLMAGGGAGAALPLLIMVLALSPASMPVPGVTLQKLDGTAVAFDDYVEGQLTLVNLWASWCPHCRRSMPGLEDAQHLDERLRVVLVNQGEAGTTVGRYMDEEGLEFSHQLLDPHARLSEATGSRGIPVTLVIDENGHVVDSHTGGLSPARIRDLMEPWL